MKTTILIATHKQYQMPNDNSYLPIHVGKEQSSIMLPYCGDNTGDHISEKNPYYCELTALYWAWKNLSSDYIGLVHYRRYFVSKKPFPFVKNKFSYILKEKELKHLLKNNTILLPKPRNYYIETNYSHYIHAHPKESIDKTKEIIHSLFPEYDTAFQIVMNRRKAHMFNIFVMKKSIFDDYCQWLFTILFELEETLDISSYDAYNQRIFGFVSELLLDVYILKHNLMYKELPVAFMENEHWIRKILFFLKRKFTS